MELAGIEVRVESVVGIDSISNRRSVLGHKSFVDLNLTVIIFMPVQRLQLDGTASLTQFSKIPSLTFRHLATVVTSEVYFRDCRPDLFEGYDRHVLLHPQNDHASPFPTAFLGRVASAATPRRQDDTGHIDGDNSL